MPTEISQAMCVLKQTIRKKKSEFSGVAEGKEKKKKKDFAFIFSVSISVDIASRTERMFSKQEVK